MVLKKNDNKDFKDFLEKTENGIYCKFCKANMGNVTLEGDKKFIFSIINNDFVIVKKGSFFGENQEFIFKDNFNLLRDAVYKATKIFSIVIIPPKPDIKEETQETVQKGRPKKYRDLESRKLANRLYAIKYRQEIKKDPIRYKRYLKKLRLRQLKYKAKLLKGKIK